MNPALSLLLKVIGGLVILVVAMSLFTVKQTELAIVLQFGQVKRTIDTPGLKMKIPVINSVLTFDKRIQGFETEKARYLTNEKKNLDVDAFVKWRIADVSLYYTSLGGDKGRAAQRLTQIVGDGLRGEFGKRSIQEVVAEDRSEMIGILTEQANNNVKAFGIHIVDVRIRRIELPDDVSDSVYRRMEAERKRVAHQLRAQGAEAAVRIRADADRQREVLMAEAYRDAEQVRGEGDAKATEIYASAYGKDKDFFAFYRSLNAYQGAFNGSGNLFLLEPDSEFFRFFLQSSGKQEAAGSQ